MYVYVRHHYVCVYGEMMVCICVSECVCVCASSLCLCVCMVRLWCAFV